MCCFLLPGDRRRRELIRIRQIYIPELIIRLHSLLVTSRQRIPESAISPERFPSFAFVTDLQTSAQKFEKCFGTREYGRGLAVQTIRRLCERGWEAFRGLSWGGTASCLGRARGWRVGSFQNYLRGKVAWHSLRNYIQPHMP